MDPIVLLADDHSMIRKGLKMYLQANLNIDDIHEASSCRDLMKELLKRKYTHMILDIILSDGLALEVIPNIRELYPELHILVFSMQPAEVYGDAMLQYGIRYYLSKTASEEEILQMLQHFFSNQPPVRNDQNVRFTGNPFARLSARELEVLHYVLKGNGTKEIAETLNLKMGTISTLKNRIFEKTGSESERELMDLASLYNINF